MKKKVKVDLFGGLDSEQYNSLAQALVNISDAKDFSDNKKIYNYLKKTPKTSLITHLVDELHELGYFIGS